MVPCSLPLPEQALLPGGFEEATLTSGGEAERVYIRQRAGFLKYCLQHGVSVAPVFAFGEKRSYANAQGCWRLRLALSRRGVPTVLPFGRLLCPILPRSAPIHVVVGAPMHVERIAHPSTADVAAVHEQYVRELTALFDRHKVQAYGASAAALELEIW